MWNIAVLALLALARHGRACMSAQPLPGQPTPVVPTTSTTTVPDRCQNVRCLNGGRCIAGFCNCVGGFAGDKCQTQTPAGIPEGLEDYRFLFGSNYPVTMSNLSPMCTAQGARVVAFETAEEWTKVYNLLQANMEKSGKTQMSFWLNAGFDQNVEKFKWLTNGQEIPASLAAWYEGFPQNSMRGRCIYAYIGPNSRVDNSWSNLPCNWQAVDFVCEIIK